MARLKVSMWILYCLAVNFKNKTNAPSLNAIFKMKSLSYDFGRKLTSFLEKFI